MVFHWSLSDNISTQVPWAFLNIQANLINAVVRMVSIPTPISNSSTPFSRSVGTVRNTPVTNVITLTLIFHIFFKLLFFAFFDFHSSENLAK